MANIWGKIVGGAAGFAIGGPIGALVGALAGHAIDSMAQSAPEDSTRQIAFTIGVIALGAKMAKADGVVTRPEIDAFKQVFHVPAEDHAHVARVFDLAKQDARGFEPYARQIAGMFPDSPEVLEKVVECLVHIARADGAMTTEELDYLHAIANIFGLDADRFARAEAGAGEPIDPYRVLGVTRQTTDTAIKAAWRKLVREHHPDTLIAQGMPVEAIELATRQLAAINAAYDRVCKERGIK